MHDKPYDTCIQEQARFATRMPHTKGAPPPSPPIQDEHGDPALTPLSFDTILTAKDIQRLMKIVSVI